MLATTSPTQRTTRQASSASGLEHLDNGTLNLLGHITCAFGPDMSLWLFLMTQITRILTLDSTRCWSLRNEHPHTPVYLYPSHALPATKVKQNVVCRSRLMNTIAMTASIGGSFQWTDRVRYSLLQMRGRLLNWKCGSVSDSPFSNTMPSSRAGLKRCPPPTPVFTGREDILAQMRTYFSNNLGKRHVFVLHGLGGAGKSQIAFKFVEECQVEAQASRCAPSHRQICMLAIETIHSIYQGFRKSFSLTPLRLKPSPQTSEVLP